MSIGTGSDNLKPDDLQGIEAMMVSSPADYQLKQNRGNYEHHVKEGEASPLDGIDASNTEPIKLFYTWMNHAAQWELNEPNAVAVATVSEDGWPSVRMVLLKGADAKGFTFFTNYGSRKGRELLATKRAAMTFHWKATGRCVRVEGIVEETSAEESDAYYATRSRDSQLGAWASKQSEVLPSREQFLAELAEIKERFKDFDKVPRPPYWSGFRLVPKRIEFWVSLPFRLHDRTIFDAVPAEDEEAAKEGRKWKTFKQYP